MIRFTYRNPGDPTVHLNCSACRDFWPLGKPCNDMNCADVLKLYLWILEENVERILQELERHTGFDLDCDVNASFRAGMESAYSIVKRNLEKGWKDDGD